MFIDVNERKIIDAVMKMMRIHEGNSEISKEGLNILDTMIFKNGKYPSIA